MNSFRKNFNWYILGIILVATIFVWYVVLTEDRAGKLTVSFLNIGQGDAIFIEAPNGNQMMIDGGPDRSVLRELGSVMPFYDRSIDLLLVTNPDKDHMAGFIEVMNFLKVKTVVEPGTLPTTAVYRELEDTEKKVGVKKVLVRRGMKIHLDKQTTFEVLFPDRDVSKLSTNTGSIVGKLVFGRSCIIFPGDAPQAIEEYVTALDGKRLKCGVLKVGHHGSRTSTSRVFLSAITPEIAVISAGIGNKYGHPHKEVIDALNDFKVRVLGTYKDGRVTLVSDGEHFSVR